MMGRLTSMLIVPFIVLCAGAMLVFLTLPPVGEQTVVLPVNREGITHVYVKDPDLNLLHRITHAGTFNSVPQISPDGRYIAFISNRTGDTEVLLMDYDGRNVRNLSQNPGRDHNPYWTPDGEWVRFSSDRSGRTEWYMVNIASGQIQLMTQAGSPPVEEERACRAADNTAGSWSTCPRDSQPDE